MQLTLWVLLRPQGKQNKPLKEEVRLQQTSCKQDTPKNATLG